MSGGRVHAGRAGLTAWAIGAIALTSMAAEARNAASESACFDALVSARIVRQTPTVIGECADGCIIMRWPWILELDVERVVEGRAPPGRLTVLTVQHTYFRSDLGARRWLLRRNDLGLFNAVWADEQRDPTRCSEGAPPAAPYISPGNGRTLADLVDEGEQRYGRWPSR